MLGVKNGWVTVCVNAQVTSDYAIVATICAATHSTKHNVRAAAQCVEVSWTSAFLLPRALTDVLFLLFVLQH